MVEPETSRLATLERRVERLTSVLIIQSVLLAGIVLMSALRTAPFVVLGLIVALPLLVFYRQSLPNWARSAGSLMKQFRSAPPPPADPDKSMTPQTPAN